MDGTEDCYLYEEEQNIIVLFNSIYHHAHTHELIPFTVANRALLHNFIKNQLMNANSL